MNEDKFERTDPAMDRPSPHPSSPPQGQASAADEAKGAASQQIQQITTDLKGGASEAIASAKGAGYHFFQEQKEKLASTLEEYSSAMEAACERLEGDKSSRLVGPAHTATTQLQRAAGYLRSHDPQDFLADIGNLARRRPELVFGTLFVAGLASARFFKASSRNRSQERRASRQRQFPREQFAAGDFNPRPEPLSAPAPVSSLPAYENTKPLSNNEW
jgi:hypothetical protein